MAATWHLALGLPALFVGAGGTMARRRTVSPRDAWSKPLDTVQTLRRPGREGPLWRRRSAPQGANRPHSHPEPSGIYEGQTGPVNAFHGPQRASIGVAKVPSSGGVGTAPRSGAAPRVRATWRGGNHAEVPDSTGASALFVFDHGRTLRKKLPTLPLAVATLTPGLVVALGRGAGRFGVRSSARAADVPAAPPGARVPPGVLALVSCYLFLAMVRPRNMPTMRPTAPAATVAMVPPWAAAIVAVVPAWAAAIVAA